MQKFGGMQDKFETAFVSFIFMHFLYFAKAVNFLTTPQQ